MPVGTGGLHGVTGADTGTADDRTHRERKGKGRHRATLSDPAGDEVLASREIADHLRRMSGTALPVLTGQAPDAGLIPIRIGLSFAPDVATAIKAGGDCTPST
jgi:hypothetical protein